MTYLLCHLHTLQPFSNEAEAGAKAEAKAEALKKKIGPEVEADPEANFTDSTSLNSTHWRDQEQLLIFC